MKTTFKATAKKLSGGLQVATSAREFKLLLDEPAELGGTNEGMNPVEALLCALGACQTIVASAFAEANGIKLHNFYVELEGDLDPDGFMGISDVRKGFTEIRFNMHFDADNTVEELQAFAKFIEATCPVGDCLTHPVKLVLSKVVKDN